MTPRERFLSVISGLPADRVPLDFQGFNNHWSPTVEGWSGYPSSEEIESLDPEVLEIEARLKDKSTVQYQLPTWINRYLVTPPQRITEVCTGSDSQAVYFERRIDTPKGELVAKLERRRGTYGMVWTTKYPAEDLEDLKKLQSVPFELPLTLGPVDYRTLPVDPFDRRLIYACVTSPAICVAGAMGMEKFLLACALEPNLIEELVSEAFERILCIMDVVLAEAGVDIVWLGGSEWLTPPMASPDLYKRLIDRWESRIIERAHRKGVRVHLHCHGNIASIIESMIARGADYTEPVEPPPGGDLSFGEAKRKAAGRIVLGGNIELDMLENGTELELATAVEEAFEGDKRGMVLATSAGSNRTSYPPQMVANIHKMIDIWENESVLEDE